MGSHISRQRKRHRRSLPSTRSQAGRDINYLETPDKPVQILESGICSKCETVVISNGYLPRTHVAGTASEVQRAAAAGCRFCTLLRNALDLDSQIATNGVAWARQTAVKLNHAAQNNRIELEPQPKIDTRNPTQVSLIFGTDDSDGTDYIHRKSTRAEPSDQTSVELARGWYENCLQNHEGCRKIEMTALPTRVICVGLENDPTIKVWEPQKGTHGEYIALSYCWGDGATVTATPNELPRLLNGFSISELPKTLQQAVEMTRKLGFGFLWIDALCILQGSSAEALKDWIHESSCMGQVYSNAAMTFAATSSRSCSEGLVYSRTCTMPCQSPSYGTTQEQKFVTVCIDGYPRQYQDEPLHERAWAFQERLLSRRILSFCLQDMMWQCDKGMVWERSPPGYIHRVHKERLNGAKLKWQVLVFGFASRSLTEPKDKLPALSSVAKTYHELNSSDEYLAGIWRSELPAALLWLHSDIGQMYLPKLKLQEPPLVRAPSWSWASLDCNIWMWNYTDPVAEVIECSVTLTSSDPFGMVSGGKITLKCKFLEGNVRGEQDGFYVGGQNIASFWLDEDNAVRRRDAKPSGLTTAVLIVRKPYPYGLFLRPSKSTPASFVRVGMFCSPKHFDIWEQAETKIVTIV